MSSLVRDTFQYTTHYYHGVTSDLLCFLEGGEVEVSFTDLKHMFYLKKIFFGTVKILLDFFNLKLYIKSYNKSYNLLFVPGKVNTFCSAL